MTVLIIDDEPGLRQTVGLILKEEGYQVHAASDGDTPQLIAQHLWGDASLSYSPRDEATRFNIIPRRDLLYDKDSCRYPFVGRFCRGAYGEHHFRVSSH